MKATRWLGISVALNAILFTLLIVLFLSPGHTPRHSDAPASGTVSLPGQSSPGTIPLASTAAPRPPSQTWVQAMRSAGVLETLIADVVAADFDRRWQQRSMEMQKKYDRGEVDDEAMTQFHLQFALEQERELRAAIGDEGFKRWDQEKMLREFEVAGLNLSAAEGESIYSMRRDIDHQRRDLELARLKGEIDEADYEKRIETEHEAYERQLKSVLGDERYAARQESSGGLQGELRRTLQLVEASDEQVDTMVKAQQQWNESRAKLEEQLQNGDLSSTAYEEKSKALELAREQEYQRALGTEGFAEFQKAQDHRYRTMKRHAKAWGLSDTDINSLYTTIQDHEKSIRDYQERAQAVEAQGEPVDWEAVQKILRDYSRQTEEALKNQLGPERFQRLKRNNVLAGSE